MRLKKTGEVADAAATPADAAVPFLHVKIRDLTIRQAAAVVPDNNRLGIVC